MIKVALISRSTMFSVPGGDTIQVLKTAEQLNQLGIAVEIFKASDSIPYERFDLLHFFNLIRPADHIHHIRKSCKPYVVSTIFVDYSEFDSHRQNRFHNKILGIMGRNGAEYLKNVYRYAKNQDTMVSPEYLLGHSRAVQLILRKASMILPNSFSEYCRIKNSFSFDAAYKIVPNGVDHMLFGRIPPGIERRDKVLCVAQFYGLKSQHSLIEACSKLNIPLELIGNPLPNHNEYYAYCKKIAGSHVKFIRFMPQGELINHYAASKVHAMPSWFETTGLTSLEAGAMGCNLVVGKGGDTRDYFQNNTWFCDPRDTQGIENAILEAMSTPASGELRNLILERFTWRNAAIVTAEAYETVLNKKTENTSAQPGDAIKNIHRVIKPTGNNGLQKEEVRILRYLSYFDVFRHPLHVSEIENLCKDIVDSKDIRFLLSTLERKKLCYISDDYVSIDPDISGLIFSRKVKEKEALKYFRKLRFYGGIVRAFPFVIAVGISGSLSKNIMDEDGDIDYFIITKANRMWIARTLLITFKKIFLLNSRKYFCLNYFIDENNLEIIDKNMFTAIELLYLLPIYNEPLIDKMKTKNRWVQAYAPLFRHPVSVQTLDDPGALKKLLEKILGGSIGENLDLFFMGLTHKRWKKKFGYFTDNKFEQTMRSYRGVSKHHPRDFQNQTLRLYHERLKKLNISE